MAIEAFIPGLDLSGRFFNLVVEPALRAQLPELRYSAALIGPGSEVLGFDTPMSTDHNWGPRVQLFLPREDFDLVGARVAALINTTLPVEFEGRTLFAPNNDGDPAHFASITVSTIESFFESLGISTEKQLVPADWLVIPEQVLLSVTAGRVFRDDLHLEAVRARFAYYPRDIWLYQLAATWRRIGQEEHLMGRAGSVGDELGSAIIGTRLVRDVVRLCFLMEQQYAPYPKWFGSAFAKLDCAAEMQPVLRAVLGASTWQSRQTQLCHAYVCVSRMHNLLEITEPIPAGVGHFHDRPFMVIEFTSGFARKISARIQNQKIRQLAELPIGGIDLVSDNTDVLSRPELAGKLRDLYE